MRSSLDAYPLPDAEWNLLASQCTMLLVDGEIDVLEPLIAHTFELGVRVGMPAAAPTFGAHTYNLRLQQNRADEVLAMYEPIAQANPNVAVLPPRSWFSIARQVYSKMPERSSRATSPTSSRSTRSTVPRHQSGEVDMRGRAMLESMIRGGCAGLGQGER